jgi:asparagine synthase (glutamine-hydrolysing)
MSGIVGIVNLDGAPVDPDLLARLTEFMVYRGPDAQQTWIDGQVGFGHTMLRTTFEAETEKQPLTLDGKVWLTADARIDGRDELIAALEGKLQRKLRMSQRSGKESASNGHGAEPRVPNDAELILLAYEAWAENCVEHLIGDFAFAIWDSNKRRLFCARDHFGVKQFYYAQIGNTFIFSNTLNCVRLHPAVSDALNEVALGDYLLFGLNQDLSSTVFSDINRLSQASLITASIGSKTIRRFWSAPTNTQIEFAKSSDYVERFKELFSGAVNDRLRSDRVSLSMSGGLDSTSVAAVAHDLLLRRSAQAKLRGYCVVYDKIIPDEERQFSTLAAEALHIPITHIAADDFSLYEERRPRELEQPEPFLMNPTSMQFNELLRLMADHSRVALSGWDGDAFMNEPPNAHFAELAKKLRIKKLLANMYWFVSSRHQLPPIGFRTLLKRLIGTYPPKAFRPEWIEESFSKSVNLPERWKEFSSRPPKAHPTRPYAFRVLNSTSWGPLFESYDAGCSRLPLEMRHPMIDVRLVEYLLSIPPVPWCVNKEILRVAVSDKLPPAVLDRPKAPLAGDPSLYQVKDGSVRFVDNFEPVVSLKKFVDLSARRRLEGEENTDRIWANLRVFGLNHWLLHSLTMDVNQRKENEESEYPRSPASKGTEVIPTAATGLLR